MRMKKRIQVTLIPDDPFKSASGGKGHAEIKVFDKYGKLKRIVPPREGPDCGHQNHWNTIKRARKKG